MQCNLPYVSECHVCKKHLKKRINTLAAKANSAVVRFDDDGEGVDAEMSDDEGEAEDDESEDANDLVVEDYDETNNAERELSLLVNNIVE